MQANSLSFTIVPEIPMDYISKFYEYMNKFFLAPQKTRYADISSGDFSISYSILGVDGKKIINVHASGKDAINAVIEPIQSGVPEDEISKSKEDVKIAIDAFEEQVRKNSLFFAWREGESIVPEAVTGKENKSLRRIFLETQIILIAAFMSVGILLFLVIEQFDALYVPLVPVVLLAIQFVFVFYSNKIVARSADWHITQRDPYIHILQYPLSVATDDANKKLSKNELTQLKQEIYKVTIAQNGELDCEKAHDIFAKFGINCKTQDLIARKVNVYDIVQRTADKFAYKVPEIIVSNTLLPNAAASGPTPSRGIVLITTGTFLQLNDEEIESVLGHEFGHLKGHDPLWLYGLSAIQYLFWFYIIFTLIRTSSTLLLVIYLWALLTLTYFVSKFFEARADLISAMVIGKPKILADSLEKIGFQRLLYERVPSFRFQEWLNWDPHPPIYFRIARLRNLEDPSKIKHPLRQSAREVIRGFFNSF
ncbi:MAG: M48 family metallopeptidase [Candidatus Bathyarchaeia archaeon]